MNGLTDAKKKSRLKSKGDLLETKENKLEESNSQDEKIYKMWKQPATKYIKD